MTFDNLLYQTDQGITTITVNRPDKLNALNYDTVMELNEAINDAQQDRNCQVIVITGSGTKAFVAGADIKEFSQYSVTEARALAQRGHTQLCDLIEQSTKPVIAAVNGFCLGGGLELAMACHIRVASASIQFVTHSGIGGFQSAQPSAFATLSVVTIMVDLIDLCNASSLDLSSTTFLSSP